MKKNFKAFASRLLMAFLLVILSAGIVFAQGLMDKKIIYVPMDDRPVNYQYVIETAKAAGMDLITPPAECLPRIAIAGDVEKLWGWIFENAKIAHTVILSADLSIYGGLVSSRRHDMSRMAINKMIGNFSKIKRINPDIKFYVFSTIMRTPKQSVGSVEPDYYEKYGPMIFRITSLKDKADQTELDKEEKSELKKLFSEVPAKHLDDWFERRAKNLAANKKLMNLVRTGVIDYFILCRDDSSPFSQSRLEYRTLVKNSRGLNENNFNSFMGADEIGMLLFARAANTIERKQPKFFVVYNEGAGVKTIPAYEDCEISKTVDAHIMASGSLPASSIDESEFVLFVNTPFDGKVREAESDENLSIESPYLIDFVLKIKQLSDTAKKIVIADVSYANGSDNAFMQMLSARKLLEKICAYSGWNTAGNTIGCVIGQAILSDYINPEDRYRVILKRFLDDWAYQANIRKEIYTAILKPENLPRVNISFEKLVKLRYLAKKKMLEFAAKNLKDFHVADLNIDLPWKRLFEVQIDIK
ncbi:MAG TPA: DUF4127 family protein [Candidatus Wallbacteria bacterium]|nr:DUF4127 family protein [Candidatus Wallbacteria bacterium]